MYQAATASAARMALPSINSRRGGSSRSTGGSVITNGAKVTRPIAWETNQALHKLATGAANGSTNPIAAAAGTAATAVATPATAMNPRVQGKFLNWNDGPKYRSISQAVSRASPAAQRAKARTSHGLRSSMRVAAAAATSTADTIGQRALGPSAIRAPAATPEASHNTAIPSGCVSRAEPSRAARK